MGRLTDRRTFSTLESLSRLKIDSLIFRYYGQLLENFQWLFAQLIERYLIILIIFQEPVATLAEHSSEEQWKEWERCQLPAEPAAKTARCRSSTRIVLPADLKSVCKLE